MKGGLPLFEIYTRPDHTEIIKNIVMDWDGLGLPDIDLTKINCRIVSPRKQGFNSLMTFIFYCNEEPLIVVKAPRYNESKIAVDSLRNEAETLKSLSKNYGLKDIIPHLYLYSPVTGVPTLITGAAKGKMFNEVIDEEEDPARLDALLTRGAQLASVFAQIKGHGFLPVDEAFIEKNLRTPLKLVAEYYPQYIDMIERSVETVLSVSPLDEKPVYKYLMHNDFNPWNVVFSADNKMTIIDWEDASFEGLPFMDLFNYYSVAHRILFVGENAYSKSRSSDQKKLRINVLLDNYKKNLEEYCKKTGISVKMADLFFLVFAANISAFFVDEKRRSISYADSWVSMLFDVTIPGCFENFVKRLSVIS